MRLSAPIPAAIVTALLMGLVAYARLPAGLGAHPWWSTQVVLIGATLGLLLALTLWHGGLTWHLRTALSAVALILAVLPAHFGKAIFAASYAENALAGRLWYFGWIAVIAAIAALLFSVLTRRGPDTRP